MPDDAVIKLPFGPWESFDACVADQKKAGHSDDAARRICGALQDKLKAAPDGDVSELTAEVVAELGLNRRLGGSPKLTAKPMWGKAIKLALAAEDIEPKKLVWVQVAMSGEWKGHEQGPFTLDRKLFEELQRNLRAHVNFRAEPAPGEGRVIQWDFHHACEEHPSLIAVEGAPAQGWIYDVALGDQVPRDKLSEKAIAELQKQEAGGVETFWALTEWLEPAASYVRDGKYLYSSIAIYPDSKEPVTGENIGWWFASCALTNRPFIEGMAPLSIAAARLFAAREPKRLGSYYYDPWDVPATIGEAFGRLKDIFEMGELASVVDVAGELAKLKSYAEGAAPPPGVDVDKLIQKIRCLLQLELLADTETIFARCEELLARAAAESQAAQPVATTRDPMPEPAVDPNKILLDTIARRLKVPSTPDDVQRAILAELEAGSTATAKLGEILSALGVEDAAGAIERIRQNAEQLAKLEAILPELAELRQLQAKDEEEDMEEDMAYAASRFGEQWETVKDAIRVYRGAELPLDPNSPDFKKQLEARRAAKKRFDDKYPRPPAGQGYLFTSVATSPTAKPGALQLTQSAQPVAAAPPPGNGTPETAAIRAEVEQYDGPNFGAKCMAYVAAKAKAAGTSLSFEQAHEKGSLLARQLTQAP